MVSLRALAILSTIALLACELEGDKPFDPRGSEVALYGEWDVNGVDPALGEECRATGLVTVELAFFEPGEADAFVDDSFRFPCEEGVYDSMVGVLRTGSFEYSWRAYDGEDDTPVMESSRYTLTMKERGEFILQAVDFVRRVVP